MLRNLLVVMMMLSNVSAYVRWLLQYVGWPLLLIVLGMCRPRRICGFILGACLLGECSGWSVCLRGRWLGLVCSPLLPLQRQWSPCLCCPMMCTCVTRILVRTFRSVIVRSTLSPFPSPPSSPLPLPAPWSSPLSLPCPWSCRSRSRFRPRSFTTEEFSTACEQSSAHRTFGRGPRTTAP